MSASGSMAFGTSRGSKATSPTATPARVGSPPLSLRSSLAPPFPPKAFPEAGPTVATRFLADDGPYETATVKPHKDMQIVKLDFGGMRFTTSVDTLTSGEGEVRRQQLRGLH